MRVKQFQKRDEDLEKAALHLRRMRKQNKELFDDKHQLRKIFLNVDDLMLKHDINSIINMILSLSFDEMSRFEYNVRIR